MMKDLEDERGLAMQISVFCVFVGIFFGKITMMIISLVVGRKLVDSTQYVMARNAVNSRTAFLIRLITFLIERCAQIRCLKDNFKDRTD